jgi:hypothetical protein
MSQETKAEHMVLVDSPEDAYAEERGWVPVAMAEGAEEAEKVMAKEVPGIDPAFTYKATGKRSFHKPVEHVDLAGEWFLFEDDGEETHDGRPGRRSEYLPWTKSTHADAAATEFWDIEVVEGEVTPDAT